VNAERSKVQTKHELNNKKKVYILKRTSWFIIEVLNNDVEDSNWRNESSYSISRRL